ncbi:MAG: family 20 glycosylhydrolase [Chitinophagaceae bacterium]|nr:family 20 glycosylhydrolase [Chitinophagaceae bacterium]
MERLRNFLLICLLLLAGNRCLAGLPVLPLPQVYTVTDKGFAYQGSLVFRSHTLEPQVLGRLQERWNEFASELPASTVAAPCHLLLLGRDPAEEAKLGIRLLAFRQSIGSEGYLLVMNDSTQLIAANTETGLFYGLQTLRQLTRANFPSSVEIADWPEFSTRVVMDDISRGPISTIDHIKYQIRRLAEIKINYLTFYIEHVVKTVSHPDIAPTDGHLTIADIRELSAFASNYHIQLIGSFQSFGHFEKILALPAYRSLGATSNLIDPDNPAAQQFLTDVIGELCDAFSAPWFNVNCDETFDLGQGSTKAAVDKMGIAAYYARHIRFLDGILQKHQKKMMLWGDFAIQHEEVLDMLPKDLTWLTWEYGIPASFDKWTQPFSKRGLSFMVCPGILNSNRLFPDHEMAVKNITAFAKAGKESGARGVFTTVWDDGGSAFFSSVWYSIYKAAEKSWNLKEGTDDSFDKRYCIVAYGDEQAKYTKALHALLQLRKLPLTWNMNDQIWYQASLPKEGRSLLLSNAGADAVELILDTATTATQTTAKRNPRDQAALSLATVQYKMQMDWRTGIPVFSEGIQMIKESDPPERAGMLKELDAEKWFSLQQSIASTVRGLYNNLWQFENQSYWLDIALQPMDERTKATDYLIQEVRHLGKLAEDQLPIPDSIASRLKVFETPLQYFQNWLFCGPFKGQGNNPPSFLYFPDDKINAIPKPGDQFSYKGTGFRWKKFASPTGGITYLEDQWPAGLSSSDWVYALASLSLDSSRELSAFIIAGKEVQVFCNGKLIAKEPVPDLLSILKGPEFRMRLPLNKGINYLVIKLPGNLPNKAFAFRLDPSVTLVNHKHKYYLDPNISAHDAE